MSSPVNKNNQTPPPANDPYSKSYGDPYGGQYGTGYDPGMGESAPPSGDSLLDSYESGDYGDYGDFSDFVGGEEDFGLEGEGDFGYGGGPQGPVDEAAVRQMLRDLQGTLSEGDYRAFQGRINATAGMSPERAQAELAAIAQELHMIANPGESVDELMGEEGAVNPEQHAKAVADFKKELEDYRDDIMGMDNLTEAEKTEFAGAVDRMINDIELAEKDPAKLAEIDIEGLRAEFGEIKSAVDAGNLHSQGVKGLAELAGLTPEELAAKAEASGVDLDNISAPPSMEILDFLMEISPELKSKIEAVETAVDARAKAIEDTIRACNEQNNANDQNDTSAQDNTSMANFQALLDLKWHQDEKSGAIVTAMKEVTDALVPLLQALYPGEEVKVADNTSGLSGWEKTHQNFLDADKIMIGGTTIDLFGAADGKIHSSSTNDNLIADEITIPTIKYDGSGTGAWKPRKTDFSFYGDAGRENEVITLQWTDDNEMGGNTLG